MRGGPRENEASPGSRRRLVRRNPAREPTIEQQLFTLFQRSIAKRTAKKVACSCGSGAEFCLYQQSR